MTIFLNTLLIIMSYLIGSITTAILVCKIMKLTDPRTAGSSNPGATNIMRLHGKGPAAITLAGDLLKGLLPVLLARYLSGTDGIIAATALAAFLGHLFPLYFGFKGGKGVATFIGVLLGCHWIMGVFFLVTWILLAKVFRISSLSALITSIMIIPVTLYLMPTEYIISNSLMVLMIFLRHRANIKNLLHGKEDKLEPSK